MTTGSHASYFWLVSPEQYIGTLMRQRPEVVLDQYVAVTSVDSGVPRLTERHERLGWQCRQGVCYSPKLRATDELLDYQLHGENVAGFDEWYVFTEPADLGEAVSGHPVMELRPGRTLVFVNYYNFAIDTTDEVAGRGLIDLFWQQLERIRPESYIADTSESLTFLTRNRGLFDSVAKGLES